MFRSSYTKVPMNPNDSKIAAACHAMKHFGLTDAIIEKAVKELLPLYDNSWKFIEEDNYKVLMDVLLPDVEGVTSSNRVAPSYIKTEVELQTQKASRRQHHNDGVLFSDSGLSRAPLKRIRLKSQADGVFLRDSKKVGYKNKEGSAESQPLLKRTSLRGKEISCSSDSEESQPLLKRTSLRDEEKAMIRNSEVPMNPNDSKIAAACHAMKHFGLTDAIIEKAVKELLPLYDNSWKFIEEDNYKVLMDVLLPDVEGVRSSNRVAPSYNKTEVELQTQEASRRQHQNDGVLFSDSGLSGAPLKRICLKSQADGVFLRDSKKVGYKNKEGSAESQPLLKRTSLRGKEIACSSDSEESQPLLKRTCLRDKGKAMIRNSKDYGAH